MWIRSQNRKGLIEAICITCSGCDNKYTLYADAIGFEDYVLGTYPTESRALEVLDEIQKHVVGKVVIPNTWSTGNLETYIKNGLIIPEIAFQEPRIQYLPTVYEMPKE